MTPYLLVILTTVAALAILLWPIKEKRTFCIVATILILPLTLLLYNQFGNPVLLPLIDEHHKQQAEARTVILTESENVKKDPKNLESWIRLGQAFSDMQQWNAASNAFKRSVVLSQGKPELIMAYARSMIMDEDGKVSDHSKQSLEMVLLQLPDHTEAKYYMNVRLLQDGKTEEAMQAMKALYKSLPDDSPVKAMINQQIGR